MRSPSRAAARFDRVLDGGIVGFAAWTLAYHLCLALRLPRSAALGLWASALGCFLLARRVRRPSEVVKASIVEDTSVPRIGIALVAAIAAAAAIGLRSGALFWLSALAAGAATFLPAVSMRPIVRRYEDPRTAWLVVACVAALAATASAVVRFPNGDDVFYLNRVLAVAGSSGSFPTTDTIFSSQRYPSSIPINNVSAYEPLLGLVFWLTRIDHRTLYYLVAGPIAVALGVFAWWRLARTLRAPGPMIVAAAAVALVLLDGAPRHFGSLAIQRSYQGKAVMVILALPVLWHHVVAFVRRDREASLSLIVACQIAAVGLSPSAALVVPICVGAGAVAVIVQRGAVPRAIGLAVTSTYPLVIGVVGAALSRGATSDLRPDLLRTPHRVALAVLDPWIMTIDTTRARWVLVVSALAGASAVVAVGRRALGVAVLGTVVLTHPWALQIVDRFGGGSVAWRMLLVLPLPVLFGLLVTVPLSMAARRIALPVTAIVAVLAVLVLALAGNPSVKRSGRVSIGAPSWDISPQLFAVAQRLTRLAGGHGTVAAPERIGQVVAMSTLDVHPVQVRRILGSRIEVEVGPRFRAEERVLVADAMNHGASDDQAVARALRDLGVRSACVAPRVVDARLERALREAGMTKRSADDSCTYWGARDT